MLFFIFQKLGHLENELKRERNQSASSLQELDEQLELMNVMDRWVHSFTGAFYCAFDVLLCRVVFLRENEELQREVKALRNQLAGEAAKPAVAPDDIPVEYNQDAEMP